MIAIETQFELWLCYAALSGLVILAIGSLAVWLCKEPIHKVRIIQWTFAACLVAPLVQVFGLTPGYEVGLVSPVSSPSETVIPRFHDSDSAIPFRSVRSVDPNREFSRSSTVAEVDAEKNVESSATPTSFPTAKSEKGNSIETETSSVRLAVAASEWLRWAWCIAAALILVWWMVGLILRRRIAAQSDAPPAHVRQMLKTIAGDGSSRVRLLTSRRMKSPVMWGLLRPTIVIPESYVDDPQALRWGLAHEWSHVERRDFLTRLLAMGTNLVCFFQPCFWWLNRELAFNQDLLADAFAAKQGHADEYAAFLVQLSKQKRFQLALGGVGMAEGGSTIFRRIRRLLASRPPLQKSGRIAAALIAIVSIVTITSVGAVRLAADTRSDDAMENASNATEGQDEEKPVDEKPKSKGKPVVHFGVVVDASTNLPIAGAKVQIKRELSRDPETGKWVLLEKTEHVTNFLGVYSFSLSAEQVAQPSLYLEVKTEHPDYQVQGWGGYSYSMIQTNMKKGDLPWFTKINLQPGETVFGTVVDPDGNPIEGVRVSSYAKEKSEEQWGGGFRGSFQKVATNGKGQFNLVIPTPGDGVLWVHPKAYAPQAIRIGDKRGNFGTLTMQPGVQLFGQILDADGNPLPRAAFNVRREGDSKEVDDFLNKNSVANGISAGAMTDADGNFKTSPLTPGSYRVQISEHADDPTEIVDNWFVRKGIEKLKHVFEQTKIEIGDVPVESITIKAIPHVTINGQYLNSAGKPRSGSEVHFSCRYKDGFWHTRSNDPGKDGKFEILLPKGATEGRMLLITNEHSSLRWKFSGMKEHAFGPVNIPGKLDSDIDGFEIVRYEAPILLVKIEDPNGKPVRGDFRLFGEQTKEKIVAIRDGEKSKHGSYESVGFEKQSDGRWRSSQMLPDVEMAVQLHRKIASPKPADGGPAPMATEPLAEVQVVTLKESETREITFVIDK